ncbi:MAG: hypothetical protein LBD31_08165 [Treponema sp.]|nr:hypothetical protein [Treponema sp.]
MTLPACLDSRFKGKPVDTILTMGMVMAPSGTAVPEGNLPAIKALLYRPV